MTMDTTFHVGVSGGKDSTAVLLWLVRESGVPADSIRASFCDTGNEHEWTYEHVRRVDRDIHPVEWLSPRRGFYDLALHRHRFPSPAARFCTQELKIAPTRDYLTSLARTCGRIVAVSGVRGDESSERSMLFEWDYSGDLLCPQWRPLLHWNIADVVAIHRRHQFPLNPLYAAGALRVGCWPCIMSRKAEIRRIADNFPERIDHIRDAENEFERRYGRFSGFFAAKVVPPRFASKTHVTRDGRTCQVPTIDDVVRWSRTDLGRDKPADLEHPCKAGFCE